MADAPLNFCTVASTDSLYESPYSEIRRTVHRVCYYMSNKLGMDYFAISKAATRMAVDMFDDEGFAIFGKPTRPSVLRRGGRPNFTRFDVGIEDGKVYCHISPLNSYRTDYLPRQSSSLNSSHPTTMADTASTADAIIPSAPKHP